MYFTFLSILSICIFNTLLMVAGDGTYIVPYDNGKGVDFPTLIRYAKELNDATVSTLSKNNWWQQWQDENCDCVQMIRDQQEELFNKKNALEEEYKKGKTLFTKEEQLIYTRINSLSDTKKYFDRYRTINDNEDAYYKARNLIFKETMAQLLAPYIEKKSKDPIHECLWNLYNGPHRDYTQVYAEGDIKKVGEKFFTFFELFSELYGGGQGFRFSYSRLAFVIEKLGILETATQCKRTDNIVQYIEGSITKIREHKFFDEKAAKYDHESRALPKITVDGWFYLQGQKPELEKRRSLWVCPWFLYPIVYPIAWLTRGGGVAVSQTWGGLWLFRRGKGISENPWVHTKPNVDQPEKVDEVGQRKDNSFGATHRTILAEGWKKFYEEQKKKIDTLPSQFGELKNKANQKGSLCHELALAVHQFMKTQDEYSEHWAKYFQASDDLTQLCEVSVKDNKSGDYKPVQALRIATLTLKEAFEDFNE